MKSRIFNGFTLIELLVVIAIIAILAAILFPVFVQAKARAKQSACASTLKQQGLAMISYCTDYDDTYHWMKKATLVSGSPTQVEIDSMAIVLQPYVKSAEVFAEPLSHHDSSSYYANDLLGGVSATAAQYTANTSTVRQRPGV